LGQRFARWQLPERWAFIDEVPKTSVGKFDKNQLRAQHAAGDLHVEQLDASIAGAESPEQEASR